MTASDGNLRLCKAGAQFRQGLAAKQHTQEQPVGAQRPPALDQLPDRIVTPMQAQGMDHQIMRPRFKIKTITVGNDPRLRHPRPP